MQNTDHAHNTGGLGVPSSNLGAPTTKTPDFIGFLSSWYAEGIAMYQPDHFRVADLPEMHALMRARPLATLVSAGSLGLYATHLPTVLRDDGPYGVIECHLARARTGRTSPRATRH
jgi:hypothetical protein